MASPFLIGQKLQLQLPTKNGSFFGPFFFLKSCVLGYQLFFNTMIISQHINEWFNNTFYSTLKRSGNNPSYRPFAEVRVDPSFWPYVD